MGGIDTVLGWPLGLHITMISVLELASIAKVKLGRVYDFDSGGPLRNV
jgi:hypothetical protein